MNRLATQPVPSQKTFSSSKVTHSLPLDEISLRGREFPGTSVRPANRPAVFCPLHYERGYAYPLIVWLHGAGESEHELRQVMPRISLRNYVAVAPRGTHVKVLPDGPAELGWSQAAEDVELADEAVLEAVDFVRSRLHVAERRIFVAGSGAGGTMALRMALARPNMFAGAVSLDGLLPRSDEPFRRVNELRGMPLLLAVRMNQPICAPQDLCSDLRLLHCAGMSVSLRYYLGEESLLPTMLADIDRWIMEVVCPSAA